jgi:hypothetical protein
MQTSLLFFRERAAAARRDAEAASLDNVRERWRCAADAWDKMADRIERTQRGRAEIEARKAALPAAELR